MAKKKDNTRNLILVGLGGILVYKLFLEKPNWQPIPNPFPLHPELPPAPTDTGGADWQDWVGAAIDIYGAASSLWQPGGAFYNEPVPTPTEDPAFWSAYENFAWP